jgi:hypothetical protein
LQVIEQPISATHLKFYKAMAVLHISVWIRVLDPNYTTGELVNICTVYDDLSALTTDLTAR